MGYLDDGNILDRFLYNPFYDLLRYNGLRNNSSGYSEYSNLCDLLVRYNGQLYYGILRRENYLHRVETYQDTYVRRHI